MGRRWIRARLALLVVPVALAAALLVRRTDTADVLRTMTVGPNPSDVVVDGRMGRAFVLDSNGTMSVLDTWSGTRLRQVSVGRVSGLVALDERTGRVFVLNVNMYAGRNGTVSVFDAHTWRLLRTVPVGYLPYAMTIDERAGRVFVLNTSLTAGAGGPVSVLDATSGRFLRTMYAGPNSGPLLAPFTLTVDARHGRLLVITGGLINNEPGTALAVLDTHSGRRVRAPRVQPAPNGVAVDEETNRSFIAGYGFLDIVETTSGRVLRHVPVGQRCGVLVDGRHGRLYMSSPTGVSILNAATGAVLRAVALGHYPAVPMAVDEQTGHVVVSITGPTDANDMPTDYGHVDVLDGRTGAVLRTVTVGMGPRAVVIDERTGHAFITTSGGAVSVPDAWGWIPASLRRWIPFLPPRGSHLRTIPGSVSMLDARG